MQSLLVNQAVNQVVIHHDNHLHGPLLNRIVGLQVTRLLSHQVILQSSLYPDPLRIQVLSLPVNRAGNQRDNQLVSPHRSQARNPVLVCQRHLRR